jgi:hypothetical protein
MKDAKGREMYEPRPGVDYCGYCKHDIVNGVCGCDGHGHMKGYAGTCGYCYEEYAIGAGTDCGCDGFGNDKETGLPLPHLR